MRKNSFTQRGFAKIIFIFFIALCISDFGKNEFRPNLSQALAAPSLEHWLGCDAYGFDIFARIRRGALYTLEMASLVTLMSLGIGVLVGTLAAYSNNILKIILLRLIDCFLAFPAFLLAILFSTILPGSTFSLICALTLSNWPGRARFVYALNLSILSRPHVESARALGANSWRIFYKHTLPHLFGQLGVQAALSMSTVILHEASLAFLGVGSSAERSAASFSSWGRLIAEGKEYLLEAPHLTLIPGIFFILAMMAFQLYANGLILSKRAT